MSDLQVARPASWTIPTNWKEAGVIANELAKSDYIPGKYKGKPGNIVAAMALGVPLGLEPMAAMRGIGVINGYPSLYGDVYVGLCSNHPEFVDMVDNRKIPLKLHNGDMIPRMSKDYPECFVQVTRKGRTPVIGSFSKQEAETAKLWTKEGTWKQYPQRMLFNRARTFALRDSFPEVSGGLYISDEAEDMEPEVIKAAEVTHITDTQDAFETTVNEPGPERHTEDEPPPRVFPDLPDEQQPDPEDWAKEQARVAANKEKTRKKPSPKNEARHRLIDLLQEKGRGEQWLMQFLRDKLKWSEKQTQSIAKLDANQLEIAHMHVQSVEEVST